MDGNILEWLMNEIANRNLTPYSLNKLKNPNQRVLEEMLLKNWRNYQPKASVPGITLSNLMQPKQNQGRW